MRRRSPFCVIVPSLIVPSLIVLAGCSKHDAAATGNGAAPQAAATVAAPARTPRPGLWAMTVSAEGMPRPMTTQVCIGAPAPGANPFVPPPQPGQACTKQSVTQTASGYAIDMQCSMNGMTMVATGEVSGDLSTSYRTVMRTKMSGPGIPAAMQVGRTSRMESKYLGSCPAGMRPNTVRAAG